MFTCFVCVILPNVSYLFHIFILYHYLLLGSFHLCRIWETCRHQLFSLLLLLESMENSHRVVWFCLWLEDVNNERFGKLKCLYMFPFWYIYCCFSWKLLPRPHFLNLLVFLSVFSSLTWLRWKERFSMVRRLVIILNWLMSNVLCEHRIEAVYAYSNEFWPWMEL